MNTSSSKNVKFNVLSKKMKNIEPNPIKPMNDYSSTQRNISMNYKKDIPNKKINITATETNDTYTNTDDNYKLSNYFIQRVIKNRSNKSKLNRTIENSSILSDKYKYLMETNKKNKYLNDNILDNIFSANNKGIDDNVEHTVIPHQIIKNRINKIKENKKKQKKNKSKTKEEKENDKEKENEKEKENDKEKEKEKGRKFSVLDANINKNNAYFKFIQGIKSSTQSKRVSLNKFSITAKLALHVAKDFDVLDEHIDTRKQVFDKFAKFKLLLKKKQYENVVLINSIRENSIHHENMLKVFISKIINQHLRNKNV